MATSKDRVAVVGAGQAGLQLALGLLSEGVGVTLVTDRSADEIRNGRVLSTQCMFGDALATERALGIDFWQDETPQIEGIRYSVGQPDGALALQFSGRLPAPAQSVDQRLKMPAWLQEVERRGGEVVVRSLDVEYVEALAREHDVVAIASAKGPFAKALPDLFPRDPERSPYDRPQRNLAVAYVDRMEPLDPPYFSICIVPGIGEYFVGPALTLGGLCYTMCFEPIPGAEMDRWTDVPLDDVDRHLAVCVEMLERFFPWEAERSRNLRLTDPLGVLKGAITPVVRQGVGHLPSGAPVLAVGDAVAQNDPLVGQGANNAAKGSMVVAREIVARSGRPFDEEWMQHVAARYWDTVRDSTAFTNMMLAPPPHVGVLFEEGLKSPAVADHIANGTNDPTTLFPWITTEDGIRSRAAEIAATASARA